MTVTPTIDVHQHLWGPRFVDELRRRKRPPYLRGWTLYTATEPPHGIDPTDHDVKRRARQALSDGTRLVGISLPGYLGVETLADGRPLLAAYHADARELPHPFRVWAATSVVNPDLSDLVQQLLSGAIGVQLPATVLQTPSGWAGQWPLLDALAAHGKPLFVHTGPTPAPVEVPSWWGPVVGAAGQLASAWWAWRAVGRQLGPQLRVCFSAGAGLAPLHHERLFAHGGRFDAIDPNVFVETSSYGPVAVDALVHVLGIDGPVHGSDRPYGRPGWTELGAAADHAIRVANPARMLDRTLSMHTLATREQDYTDDRRIA